MSDRYLILDCPQCRREKEVNSRLTSSVGTNITVDAPFMCGLCHNLGKVRVSKANIPVIRFIEDRRRTGGGFWARDETAIGQLGALTGDEACPE